MSGTFAYQAVDASGQRCRGLEVAANAALLTQTLEARGFTVLTVEEAAGAGSAAMGLPWRRKQEVLEITRALAALLPAGMPLARAVASARLLAGGEVGAALDAVGGRVERGDSLAAALGEHPRLFSPLYIGLVRAGERSGSLDQTFTRLAAHLERSERFRAKLVSLSIYPALLAGAGSIAVLVLLLFVIPRFAELLSSTGLSLPTSTRILVGIASVVRNNVVWLVAALVALGLFAVWTFRNQAGRRFLAETTLKIPLVRSYRQYAAGAQFARLASTLLQGGAPLMSALDDTRESISDPTAKAEVDRVRARVREGAALHACLAQSPVFPALLPQLVLVGEESGRLAEFLGKAADLLEERTERGLERLGAAAEPAMIVVFGGLVGFVALSLLQAIYSVNAGAVR